MKIQHWTGFLFILTMVIFTIFSLHVLLVNIQTDEDLGAQAILLDCSKSALLKADLDKVYIFEEEDAREAAIAEFKECYNIGYQKAGYKADDMYYYVPCIFLVDDNGYYVNYSKLVDNNGVSEITNMTTGLNTWTENYGDYIVKFHLSNLVEVTKPDGTDCQGDYLSLYAKLGSPSDLSFMSSKETFEDERNSVVCYITEEAINYYITTHNDYVNRDERKYVFTMPRIDNFESRLMDQPSVISFVQGIQRATGKGYINAFAFTGAIKDKAVLYYEGEVNGQLFYHMKDCPDLVLDDDNKVGHTMDDCAADGASPCPNCIK